MSETILIERDEAVATVTINRPEKLNALDRTTWVALGEAMDRLSADDDVRCVVLRGAGTQAFAAGADISAFPAERATPAQVRRYSDATDEAVQAINRCRHPVIAMIHGHCLGGGLEIAATCDMRIAGESARFAVPVKRTGLFLSYDLLATLVAVAGRAAALELTLEGRTLDSVEALAKGLVNRVVPDTRLAEEAYATAGRIAEGAPLAARFHRRAIRRVAEPRPITETEIEASHAYADSEDYQAAYKAFIAKEKPRFRGR